MERSPRQAEHEEEMPGKQDESLIANRPRRISGSPPEFYPCDSCGHLIPTERAYADMKTITVLCPRCFQERLRPCEQCGAMMRAAAYQELATGRVICESCALREMSS
jgi:ubiquitin